jgi:hypothetical protein
MHGDDVGVIQIRDGDGFTFESLGAAFIHEQAGRHDLDRDLSVERDLMRQKDGCHGPAAELAADLELSAGGTP